MIEKKIAVLDYGLGNVKSILNALDMLNIQSVLTNDIKVIESSHALILPGVGAFAKGMENLQKHNLIPAIHNHIASGKSFMGICLGMQLLLDESTEFGVSKGLGLIKGKVNRLNVEPSVKLPHISWNTLIEPEMGKWIKTPLAKVNPDASVYFVHSYAAVPDNESDVLSYTRYSDITFCSSVRKENIIGVQFHPEKSGQVGLEILKNFINLS